MSQVLQIGVLRYVVQITCQIHFNLRLPHVLLVEIGSRSYVVLLLLFFHETSEVCTALLPRLRVFNNMTLT